MISATRRNEARREVSFRLRSPAARAYVYGAFGHGTSGMIEMAPDGTDRWRTTLALSPGTYRYRFYINDGRLLIYCPTEDSPSYGMDQTVVVPGQCLAAQEGES